ncbi:hypothetical protein MTBBW1_20031 [Desulfamplus magnetovallimortis]|uniref:Uncharacterized protein n=1 Tax=Desulfamplus magnetovallimortis TaxID=1246637 RepID=A0A1W1HBG4_9BACT|nr:hypothetical protein MTBBW1_20031 [Desulfamplus magnetovallimortis]
MVKPLDNLHIGFLSSCQQKTIQKNVTISKCLVEFCFMSVNFV